MKFQLIALDEYRSTSIVGTFETAAEASFAARTLVTDANVQNALAVGERDRNWEAYFVEIFNGEKADQSLIYAGFLPDGKTQKAYSLQEDGVFLVELADEADTRIFLGTIERGKEWYLKDRKGNLVKDLTNTDLTNKTVYFVKAI